MATKNKDPRRLLSGLVAFALGMTFAIGACGVLASHARLFSQKRDTAVMIGTQLPELKSEVALLEASVEAEQIFAEQALFAREEQAAAYVLPEGSPVSRAVSAIQEIVIGFQQKDAFRIQKLTFNASEEDHGSYKTIIGSMVLRGGFDETASLLSVLGFGGDMMVRDVLSVQDQQAFLSFIEANAPLSLKGAEDFLYLDLVQYAYAPDREEKRMLGDAPPDIADEARSMLLQAGLSGVRGSLGPVAEHLKMQNLWPLPLLRIGNLHRDGDLWTAALVLYAR